MTNLLGSTTESLELLPYHRAIVDYLKRGDPDVWKWFATSITDAKHVEEVRFDLLKATYRIEPGSRPELFEAAARVAAKLRIDAPVNIYQSQNPLAMSASLAYIPGEIHLVLHGPLTEKLTGAEIECLFGHEIAHYLLWQRAEGELLVAQEMLGALAHDARAHPAHYASLRLFGLYTEIFCDRASYFVKRDLDAVVSMLVKVYTGVEEVNAESYLRQADEVFAHKATASAELTHPEAFIRARAVRLWAENAPDVFQQIGQMIEGQPGMDELDLLAQERMQAATRRLIDALLCHKWFQTDLTLAHARLYFDDYAPPAAELTDRDLAEQIRIDPDSLRDYWCFVLLDFASADRELDEVPLAKTLAVAEQLGIKPRLMEVARQELRLRKNQVEKIDQQKEKLIQDADRAVLTES